ncbi:serine threonine kinase [Pyrenophora seminiperda CCB06]|uniref:non-specific serine/threonine protein kinase n=1 Tax=Pyrenophora seminiperda CCB06 TaxID=1302712 RepID=A0A3M7MA92_9PLEO|nr:serine threonine kinase [Pyrenophora seminiperda CCB06]
MSNDSEPTVTHYSQYYPQGVKRVLTSGGSAFIGEIDDSTVFKYSLAPGVEVNRLEAERKILEIVGRHERIIALKGFSEEGIYLERAVNGTIADYILDPDRSPSLRQRLLWCRELAEAIVWIHARRVLHCDIQPTNVLLDEELHIKLSDFQGRHLSENGEILLDGWACESCRFSCPRDDAFDADITTDLFALGCTIYFIMVGHAVFPDIINGEDDWHEKVEHRFVTKQFPQDQHACSTVTLKCWQKEYQNAAEIVRDLVALEEQYQIEEAK